MFEIMTTNPSANVSRTIRFDEDLFYVLKRISKSNKVSFNSLVLQCCRYALSNMNETPPVAVETEVEHR